MKILIPIAIVIGLVGAIVTFQRFFPSAKEKEEEVKQTPSISEPLGSDIKQEDKNEDKKAILFDYKPSDPILSKPDSPYSTPSEDYKPDRPTKDGYTVTAKDGIAIVQVDPNTVKYIVTDTCRDNHKVVKILGYTTNPTIIYADTEESHASDPYSGIDGLFVGKTISYGYIIQATPHKTIIKRLDGGKTYITFSRNINEKNGNKAEAKEELIESYTEDFQPPKAEPKEPEGVHPPQARG
jgi:hypothetical protein